MSSISTAGQPITADEAEHYIKKQMGAKKFLKMNFLKNLTAKQINADAETRDANTYFNSDANAFIFSKELIMRFFEPQQGSTEEADYVMVILGAKYKDDQELGNPTIIIAGVNESSDEPGTYFSLDISDPATEQPPRHTIVSFPSIGIADGLPKIKFKIL